MGTDDAWIVEPHPWYDPCEVELRSSVAIERTSLLMGRLPTDPWFGKPRVIAGKLYHVYSEPLPDTGTYLFVFEFDHVSHHVRPALVAEAALAELAALADLENRFRRAWARTERLRFAL
jgi:hypothetical protein